MTKELKAAYRRGMEDTIITLEQSMHTLRIKLNEFPKEDERKIAQQVIDEILQFLRLYAKTALTEAANHMKNDNN